MSGVWEWVKNITLIIILFSFVEILLPGSTMQKYLKFVFSLAILAMILSPLAAVSPEEISVAGSAYVSEALRQQSIQAEGEEEPISRVQTKQIETVYREKLVFQLQERLKEKFPGITVASVEIYINNEVRSSQFGKPEKALITIDDPDYEKAVRDASAELLQLEKRSVTIALTGE